MWEPTRRIFLKASGLAALGTALAAAEETQSPANPSESAPENLVAEVNLLQGTDSNGYFSHGNTLPIAALPFGMAHWTLQSSNDSAWMFLPADRRIQGFRCTHQLSPWLSDYGHALFLPFSGDPDPAPDERSSSFRPEEAELSPCALRLKLLRYEANVNLVPTERCCLLTTTFSGSGPRGL